MLHLKKHIVTEIIKIFLAVNISLILIMIGFQFAKLLGDAATGKITAVAVFKLASLYTIKLFILLTPFSFFISILIGLSKLSNSNELIAMRSIGYGGIKIYQALFSIAIPLALLLLFLTMVVLPKILSLSYQLKANAKKESELTLIQPGNFHSIGRKITVFTSNINGKNLYNFFIWQKVNGGQSITLAKKGRQIKENGESKIELIKGSRYSWSKDGSYFMLFERLVGSLPSINPTGISSRVRSVSTNKLLKNPTLKNSIEFQRRLIPSISILLLALFAPLLVQFNPRDNRYGKFIIAIFIYVLYLNSQYILKAFIEDKKISIFPGIYIAHVIFLVFIILWFLIGRYKGYLKNKIFRWGA